MGTRYDEMMRSKKFLPLKMDELTPELRQKAQEELKETDELRFRCVKELRKRLQAEDDLIYPPEDSFLIEFLRARKFDLDRAYKLILQFYKVKRAYAEIYDTFDADVNRLFVGRGHGACLPYRNIDGCAVILVRIDEWDPKEFNMITAVRFLTNIVLYAVEFQASQVCGVHIILDAKGCSLKHVRAVTPYYLNLLAKALKNCFPVRFKGIHFYNESVIFQYMWSVIKLFLTEKIIQRVHFHGDSNKSLHKHISKEILPAEYGGDNKDFDSAKWANVELESYYEKFYNLTQTGYDMQ